MTRLLAALRTIYEVAADEFWYLVKGRPPVALVPFIVPLGFAVLFGGMFGDANVAAGYVVWRSVEYFLPVLAAIPLLSLRSDRGQSIAVRWARFKRRTGSATSKLASGGRSKGGISVNPKKMQNKGRK